MPGIDDVEASVMRLIQYVHKLPSFRSLLERSSLRPTKLVECQFNPNIIVTLLQLFDHRS
jgi:hypothetical protein